MSLDGFSMRALTRELAAALTGGRIDKITQPTKELVLLSVRQPGKNHLLTINVGAKNPAAYLREHPLESPKEPPVFCMVLRKHLEGSRIGKISQVGLDRLIEIELLALGAGGVLETKTLMLELVGKYSNIILLKDGLVLDALKKIGAAKGRVRTVLAGEPYELPPTQGKLRVTDMSREEFFARLRAAGERSLANALLDTLEGFGPVSAREAARRAGLPADIPANKLDEKDLAALYDALLNLLRDIDERPAPTLLLSATQKVRALAAFPLAAGKSESAHPYATVSELLEAAEHYTQSYVPRGSERLKKIVKNELTRAQNKLEKLAAEEEAAENAEQWKIYGDNLQTYQYQLEDHAESATVANIYSADGAALTIPLDPRLTILQNMQACYKKYDKLKRGKVLLKEQQRECRENIDYLESIAASLRTSTSLKEFDEIKNELIRGRYLLEKPKKKPSERPSRPYSFRAPDGTEILVGKNNLQNDRLTTKTAARSDLWLHTQKIPGSHVILRTGGHEPSEETLALAAMLAAHFSQAQGGSQVPVDYTEIRHVKKPSGSKPGFVIFTDQKTLYVTEDEQELAPILAQNQA